MIHSVGIIDDCLLMKKEKESFDSVVLPKTRGVINLDEATGDDNLDWFVMFSSITGVIGNLGQADYASANGFLDAFAEYRERLRLKNRRNGKTFSIDWPLWEKGGMKLDQRLIEIMAATGLKLLSSSQGIRTLQLCLSREERQLVVFPGEEAKIKKRLKDLGYI